MSSRLIEKEERREERLRQEGQQAAHARRSRRLVAIGSLLAGAFALTAVAVLIGGGGDVGKGTRSPSTAQDGAAFGPHYAGLVQRREAAGLPTMMDTMSSPVHFHPLLKVFVNGKSIPVPANIGIDPNVDPMQMAGLHTHDTSGTIHVEGVTGARLGQFFAVWGVALSARRLGPYESGQGNSVRMWVDGKPSTAFGSLKLADGQDIVVSYGRTKAPAPRAP